MDSHDTNADHDHGSARILEVGVFLVVLTAASFLAAFMDRQSGFTFWNSATNTIFVLMVAFAKATLVVLFFMHLKFERAWKYMLTVPPILLGLALVSVLTPDVAYSEYHSKNGWAPPAAVAPDEHVPMAGKILEPPPGH